MGDCCKTKNKQAEAKPVSAAADCCSQKNAVSDKPASAQKSIDTGSRPLSQVAGVTLAEIGIAAGIIVFLPILLNKIAPNAMRAVRDGFELASKSMK